jgi:hypothetical protein
MTLEASVLGDGAVRATAQGYEVDLRLPWYRSLPVSCLEDVSISLGGQPAARDSLRVVRAGRPLALGDLAVRVDDEWFVQDPLTVAVQAAAPPAKGQAVELEVTVTIRVPYILVGPGKALTRPTRVRRKVVVQ